jgi:mRNA interferase HigB
MKVHLIRKETIEGYAIANARSRSSFEDWLEKIKHADWKKPMDMKQTFGATDLLGRHSSRVIFDIGGNNFRMICKYAFGDRQVHLFICWIGTHTEYDELCGKEEKYIISSY